jgi:SAM-dependent methyltransferase
MAAPIIPEVVQLSSHEEVDRIQSDAIRAHAEKLKRPLSILEAGCGQRWMLDLGGLDYTLTGVDLDAAALNIRKTQVCDLDETIVGDLCSIELPPETFDVIYSSFVLEHVPQADRALDNLIKWLRPGGTLILQLPDRLTARAFLTRLAPFWAHVWFHRYVYGFKSAGQPGHAPYPTYYHPVVSRERLCRFLAERGVACRNSYGDGFRRDGQGLLRLVVHAAAKFTAFLSFGRLTADYINLVYIAVKEQPA